MSHPVPFSFLVAARSVGMGFAIGCAGDAEFLLGGCRNVSGEGAGEHRDRKHEQEFLRRHAAFSFEWDGTGSARARAGEFGA